MMDIRTVVSLFEIALGTGVMLFLVLIFSSMCTLPSYHIAAGNIDEDLLKNLLVDIVTGRDYDENLKLDLYNAILN